LDVNAANAAEVVPRVWAEGVEWSPEEMGEEKRKVNKVGLKAVRTA
jgi:hypothetical protein